MRLWSIHPKYLDSLGLVALWRESLLAQKVLQGATRGYRNHPQLLRFKNTGNPVGAIADYLRGVVEEAQVRDYRFDRDRIAPESLGRTIPVTTGQSEYEFTHLLKKLQKRDPERYDRLRATKRIELHPVFEKIDGDVEAWEVI